MNEQADPPRVEDLAGYDEYHRQMFDLSHPYDGFSRWKIQTTGISIAQNLASARNRGLADYRKRHGDPDQWVLPHPPAVLWTPATASAACFGCFWLDRRAHLVADAAAAARLHAGEHVREDDEIAQALIRRPIKVWRRDAPQDEPGPEVAP